MEGQRKSTKSLKPPLPLLKKLDRVHIASYFDDLIIMEIIKLMSSLGLIFHP